MFKNRLKHTKIAFNNNLTNNFDLPKNTLQKILSFLYTQKSTLKSIR